MDSQVSDNANRRGRVNSAPPACRTSRGARPCLCAPWSSSGYDVLCEGELPLEGPTAISVIMEGGLSE